MTHRNHVNTEARDSNVKQNEQITAVEAERDHLKHCLEELTTFKERDEFALSMGFTPSEEAVFVTIRDANGRTVTKDQLMSALYWREPQQYLETDPKIIQVFLCKIRHKMDGKKVPGRIATVWGAGYRWEAGEHRAKRPMIYGKPRKKTS